MKVKDPKKHVQFDKSRSGCGLGCCSIGCMGIIGMFILVGVVGYYGLWHSGIPLQIIESAIEENGDVEIEGLTGTLASGFSADEFRFKTADDRWSTLTDIKFKYDSDGSLFGTDRLVIEELSVNGGTIYADWDPDENEIDLDPDDLRDELQEIDGEFKEFGEEMREEVGRSPAIRELRIDLVSVANIKIINPATQLEVTIDEVKFDGFKWEEGDLQSLGELFVRSSQLDLKTVPSVEFAEMKNARRFEGTLGAQADHRLNADVPFVFDFCVDDKLQVFSRTEIFDGQIRIVEGADQTTLSYLDFSPGGFIDLKNGAMLPSNVNLELEFGENEKQGPDKVNNDGEFKFGKTKFGDLRIEKPEDGPPIVVATGSVNGETVLASLKISRPFLPWINISLKSEAFDTPEDLWGQTLYGTDFEELTSEEQMAVRASMPEQKVDPPEDQDQDQDQDQGAEEKEESVETEEAKNALDQMDENNACL